MKFRLAMLPVVALLVSLGALAGACSGGDDSDAGDPGPTATDEPSDGDSGDSGDDGGNGSGSGNGNGNGSGGAGSGSGSATLTVGGQSWTFADVFCAFSPEEAGNDRVSFFVSSFGETSDGVRIQLDATIQDPDNQGRYDGENVIKTVSVNDVEDFENPSVDWSSIAGGFNIDAIDFQVDGKNVAVEAVFNDGRTAEIETEPGTLTATCP